MLTARPVSLFPGHSQALPERWGLGGAPAPPLGASPVIQRRRGHHAWGDNDPGGVTSTVAASGSLAVPGGAAVPVQNQPWHGSPPPSPCGWRPRAPRPALAGHGWIQPAGMNTPAAARGDGSAFPASRSGALPPGHVAAAASPARERCQCREHDRAEIFPRPEAQTGRERGRREEEPGTRGRARHRPPGGRCCDSPGGRGGGRDPRSRSPHREGSRGERSTFGGHLCPGSSFTSLSPPVLAGAHQGQTPPQTGHPGGLPGGASPAWCPLCVGDPRIGLATPRLFPCSPHRSRLRSPKGVINVNQPRRENED